MDKHRHTLPIWFTGLFLALIAAYSNHFNNGFHFDDFHTVVYNPVISKLSNIPRFFADARTFSQEPLHQTYRPLVTASLAIDFALGQGKGPFWFHFSTFCWFIVQLILMYVLFRYVLELTCPNADNSLLALFPVAIYGLHPVSAETVNYVIQRGDLYATLGVVAGVVVYAWKPGLRRFGFYLLPAFAGMLAKPSALIFAPILAAYIFLIDYGKREKAGTVLREKVTTTRKAIRKASRESRQIEAAPPSEEPFQFRDRLISTARQSIPAFILCAAYWFFQKIMTPASVVYALKTSPLDYWITQPYVTLRYFRSFFLPFYLKLDTDFRAFHSPWSVPAMAGFAFCGLLAAAAAITARTAEWRPVSFGLWWFIFGLVPTALQPLDEVENDHRMFLPFVGLALAVVCASWILMRRSTKLPMPRLATVGVLILMALAWGTHQRNEVWHTEESLWRDNVEKSPNNARAHYDLGRALQNSGRLEEAMAEYRTTVRLWPEYSAAHNNLGIILLDQPGRLSEAISEFEAALRLDPNSAECHNDLGTALVRVPGRLPEAIAEYQASLKIWPDFATAHNNLGAALSQIPSRIPEAISEYQTALRVRPELSEAHYGLGLLLANIPDRSQEALSHFEIAQQLKPDAETRQMIEMLQRRGIQKRPTAQ
jgi:protein O-mannosyl-transferase